MFSAHIDRHGLDVTGPKRIPNTRRLLAIASDCTQKLGSEELMSKVTGPLQPMKEV